MKKYILSITFTMLTIQIVYCQFEFGVKAGINIANVNFDEATNTKTKTGIKFNSGILAQINFGKTFFLRPEVNYSIKGWKVPATSVNQEFSMNLHYLNIPILVGYKILPEFTVAAGPELGFLMMARISENPDFESFYEKLDFGIALGAGYRFTDKFGVEVRYIRGFNTLIKAEGRDESNNPTGEIYRDGSNRVFQFNLIYLLIGQRK